MSEKKEDFYRLLIEQAKALTTGEEDALANLSNIASLLFTSMTDVNWAGFYISRGEQLVLGPFMGSPACVRISFGHGVCGRAASEKKTLRVKDVHSFPGHIACDTASRSEIVIPFVTAENVMAVLDIDSPITHRFDDKDQVGLEALVAVLRAGINFSQLSY